MLLKRPLPQAALCVMQLIDETYVRNLVMEGLSDEEILSLFGGANLENLQSAV